MIFELPKEMSMEMVMMRFIPLPSFLIFQVVLVWGHKERYLTMILFDFHKNLTIKRTSALENFARNYMPPFNFYTALPYFNYDVTVGDFNGTNPDEIAGLSSFSSSHSIIFHLSSFITILHHLPS
jgi:hypothetical protein